MHYCTTCTHIDKKLKLDYASFNIFVPYPGTYYSGQGTAFSSYGKRLRCTLLALWEEEYSEPWFILTDLLPVAVYQ